MLNLRGLWAKGILFACVALAWQSADCYGQNASRGADPPKVQELADDAFVGNLFSFKFHYLNCPFGQIMAPHNRVALLRIQDAEAMGFKRCRYCFSPVQLSVTAKLVKRDEPTRVQEAKTTPKE